MTIEKDMKAILITGAGGFIGSRLVESLQADYNIICLDRGRRYPELKKIFTKNVKLVKGDICDRSLIDKLTKGVDIIIHLASVVGEASCVKDPLRCLYTNIYATDILLDAAKKNKIKTFVYGSSYWAYSTFKKRRMPLKETDEPRADSLYGGSKFICEEKIKSSGIDYLILRFATVYGHGTGFASQQNGLIGKYIVAAFNGEPLKAYGTGSQKIDFIHVDDVVDSIVILIKKNIKSRIFNLGGGKPMSVAQIAGIVKSYSKEIFGKKAHIQFLEAPPGKVWPDKWVDIKKIKAIFKDYPRISLDAGIKATMKAYKESMQ